MTTTTAFPSLTPAHAHGLVEPSGEREEEEAAAEMPRAAVPTSDPNRYTIYVPSEHTCFSMGQPGPSWIPDPGITGKSDHHIHWFVVGQGSESQKTMVTLGAGATSVQLPRHDADVGNSTDGYAMITGGLAWHESEKSHFVIAREGLIAVRALGGDIGIQADEKKVFVFGEKGVALGSKDAVKLMSDPSLEAQAELRHDGDWLHEATANMGSKELAAFVEAAGVIAVAKTLHNTFKAWHRHVTDPDNFQTWYQKATPSLKTVIDMAVLGTTVLHLGSELLNIEAAGTVSARGSKYVGISAGINATVYANVSAGLIAGGHAEVIAGGTAAIIGMQAVEVIGKAIGIEGHNVEVAGKDEVVIVADKELKVAGKVEATFGGGKLAALVAQTGTAAVVAVTDAVLVAGATQGGAGAGVIAGQTEVTIGMMTKVAPEGSEVNKDAMIEIKASEIKIALKQSKIKLEDSLMEIDAKVFSVKAGGGDVIYAESGKILIA